MIHRPECSLRDAVVESHLITPTFPEHEIQFVPSDVSGRRARQTMDCKRIYLGNYLYGN